MSYNQLKKYIVLLSLPSAETDPELKQLCFDFLTFLVSSCVAVFSRGIALCLSAVAAVFCCGLQWYLYSACVIVRCVNLSTSVSKCVRPHLCYSSVPSADMGADDDDIKTCLLGYIPVSASPVCLSQIGLVKYKATES